MAKLNHHLEERNGVWYFRQRVDGKLKYKKLSESVMKARVMRDKLLSQEKPEPTGALFGEVATNWAKHQETRIEQNQIKASTWRDWRSSVNRHVLPFFGNTPIKDISIGTVERFIDSLGCSAKRINNILVPVRSIFKYAKRHGHITSNIMGDVDNLKLEQSDIYPFTIEEVNAIIGHAPEQYKPFFITDFFTGCRFGELAALKWHQVDFTRKLILIRETLVYGEEGRTKTMKSKRDVDMLPPVVDALNSMKRQHKHVFIDRKGDLLTPDHVREVIWKPTLEKAGIEYRPPIQTRHTFATLMIDAGEDLGWVQRMLGHGSLQMIYTRYYSWVRKSTRNDGSAFLAKVLPLYEQKEKGLTAFLP